ncbi:MAG: hypothetical protein IPN83_26595 [Holophagales bacterium]|nr:hypothetical protein [Holophagales bacterium]
MSPGTSAIAYDAPKPLEEDKVAGAKKLGLNPERVRPTPAGDVFAH